MAGSSLKGRSFVDFADINARELVELLELAGEMKRLKRAGICQPALEGQTLGLLFQKPSLRTRTSFAVAMNHLGGHAIYLSPQEIGMGTREAVDDVALVLSRYFDVIAARVFGHAIVQELAEHATVPVINALSDAEHPCQALADLLTVKEWLGDLQGLTLSYIGDGNNVAISLASACALAGMNFRIAAPAGYQLSAQVEQRFAELTGSSGAVFAQTSDPREAASGANVLYTDVWTSMGQEEERKKRLEAFQGYCIDQELLDLGDDAIVLHCLPAHYGEEITREVSRGPRSAIWDQAENRLHAQKALLALLV